MSNLHNSPASGTALTIQHNFGLAVPDNVIVQLYNPDLTNYYYSYKVFNYTANTLDIQLVSEPASASKIVKILG